MITQALKSSVVIGILMTSLCATAPLSAHHSYAMFDKEKTSVIKGTLYAVEWKNPHSWIWVAVKNNKGGTDIWGLEGTSPASMTRLGFTKSSLVVGTEVTATLNPLKDGRMGGGLVELKFADGRVTR